MRIFMYAVFEIFRSLSLEKPFQIVHVGSDAAQKHIHQRNSSHGFQDYNSSWNNDGIMASFYNYLDGMSVLCDRILLLRDGRCRLDGGTQKDVTSIADAAKNPAGMVGKLDDLSIRT